MGDATLTVVAVDDVGLLVRSTIAVTSTSLCLTGVLRHSSGAQWGWGAVGVGHSGGGAQWGWGTVGVGYSGGGAQWGW